MAERLGLLEAAGCQAVEGKGFSEMAGNR